MEDQSTCPRCSSARLRIVRRSQSPATLHLAYEDCGQTTASASPRPLSMFERHRVERVVRSFLLDDNNRAVELLSVKDAANGWHVIVRTEVRRVKRVHLVPTTPSALRLAIKRTLEAQ